VTCLWVLKPDLGGDLSGNGANPLLHVLAWVVGMVYGGDGWQMCQDVLLGVVDGCGS